MVIVFDGKCGLCNKTVNWILKNDQKAVFKFTPIQGDFAKKTPSNLLNIDNPNSIILLDNGLYYQKSDAIFRILKKLPFPWKLLNIFSFLPLKLTDYFYNFIAANRYRWFGKTEHCRVPLPEEKERFID